MAGSSNEEQRPGADDFSMKLFQKCWEIVQGNFMEMFYELHNNVNICVGINSNLCFSFQK